MNIILSVILHSLMYLLTNISNNWNAPSLALTLKYADIIQQIKGCPIEA